MSAEENKKLASQFIEELINQHDLNAADKYVSPTMIENEAMPAELPSGSEGTKAIFTMTFNAFPDFHATIEHLIAEDDKVAAYMRWTGTHEGEFMGIPATGKPMSISVVDIFRFADGKIVEHWGVTDMMTMMQQLGVMPA